MLNELVNVRQHPEEHHRHWFCDEEFELIVWFEESDRIVLFELSYFTIFNTSRKSDVPASCSISNSTDSVAVTRPPACRIFSMPIRQFSSVRDETASAHTCTWKPASSIASAVWLT